MYTHKTKCMYKYIQPIQTYIYIQYIYIYIYLYIYIYIYLYIYIYIYIYIQKHKTNLNAHTYLNILIVKKHIKDNVKINCNLLSEKS